MWILIIEDLAGTLVTSFFWTKAKGEMLSEKKRATPLRPSAPSSTLMNNGGQKWNDRTINCCPGQRWWWWWYWRERWWRRSWCISLPSKHSSSSSISSKQQERFSTPTSSDLEVAHALTTVVFRIWRRLRPKAEAASSRSLLLCFFQIQAANWPF